MLQGSGAMPTLVVEEGIVNFSNGKRAVQEGRGVNGNPKSEGSHIAMSGGKHHTPSWAQHAAGTASSRTLLLLLGQAAAGFLGSGSIPGLAAAQKAQCTV